MEITYQHERLIHFNIKGWHFGIFIVYYDAPQGSHWVLFCSIYSLFLMFSINSKYPLYADDMKIFGNSIFLVLIFQIWFHYFEVAPNETKRTLFRI